jgi:hypothetical protein
MTAIPGWIRQRHRVKMVALVAAVYPRKNWSSFMLLGTAHPLVKTLTPEVLNQASEAV